MNLKAMGLTSGFLYRTAYVFTRILTRLPTTKPNVGLLNQGGKRFWQLKGQANLFLI